jgi:uncharacterized protein (DUF1810 family)
VVGDGYDLQRFVVAQDHGASYQRAIVEIRAGHKTGHWIWWVFPQLVGLGSSATSMAYSIVSLGEARAYLAHSVLGPRLVEATTAMLEHSTRSVASILGPDDVKFRSSMTLFMRAAPTDDLYRSAIDTFVDGVADERTDELLEVASAQ